MHDPCINMAFQGVHGTKLRKQAEGVNEIMWLQVTLSHLQVKRHQRPH